MSLTTEGRSGRIGAFLDAVRSTCGRACWSWCCSASRPGCRWRCRARPCACGWPTAASIVGTIGLLTLVGLPYTLKFLWAPVVDALNVPWLSARLGRRRGWLVASQLLLMATIVFLGTRDPVAAPLMVGLAARSWSPSPPPPRTSSSTPTGSRACPPTSRPPAWPATWRPIASACWPPAPAWSGYGVAGGAGPEQGRGMAHRLCGRRRLGARRADRGADGARAGGRAKCRPSPRRDRMR